MIFMQTCADFLPIRKVWANRFWCSE